MVGEDEKARGNSRDALPTRRMPPPGCTRRDSHVTGDPLVENATIYDIFKAKELQRVYDAVCTGATRISAHGKGDA